MPEAGNATPEAPRGDKASYWRGGYANVPAAGDAVQGDYHQPGYGPTLGRIRRAYAAQAVKQKDHVAAGLFAIFLGFLGMHKFYLGYNKPGFIIMAVSVLGSVVTFGLAAAVMWVLAIIEGAIYFSKSQTEFDNLYVRNERPWF